MNSVAVVLATADALCSCALQPGNLDRRYGMASRDILKLLTRARKGEPDAQLAMGRLYLVGTKGVSPNSAAAMTWLLEAWRRGQQGAANDIVAIETPALSQDQELAYLDACRHAAAKGSAEGAFALGQALFRSGEPGAAIEHFRNAAELGSPKAALRLGRLLLDQGAEQHDRAEIFLHQAACAGEEDAVAPLASLLLQRQSADAIPWLRKLADGGDVRAMDDLARLLLESPSAESIEEARRLLVKSSQRGDALAMWRWGRLQVKHFKPEPIQTIASHSPKRAKELLERAAALGVSAAHWDLARLYALPQSSICDLRAARRHLEAAAGAGIAEAQVLLARRLIQKRDEPEAWIAAGQLLEAARTEPGCESLSEKLLDEIADHPPAWPEEIKAAQDSFLPMIESRLPLIAARLRLAAAFGLTTRETLYLDLSQIDRGWCLFADLRQHFRYRPWRLVRAIGLAQGDALREVQAVAGMLANSLDNAPLLGTTRARARRLASVLQQGMQIDPGLFIQDWQPPS